MDRVFIPLTKEAFNDFMNGKTFELRRAERGWNRNQLRQGRTVTLSCGYSGPRMEGFVIGKKIIFGSLDEIFAAIPFEKIEPRAKNVEEAKKENLKTLGCAKEYVAFEIGLRF